MSPAIRDCLWCEDNWRDGWPGHHAVTAVRSVVVVWWFVAVAAADAATLGVVAVRTLHVTAVVIALILMYRPTANMFFRRAVKGVSA
jgi:hypothetical protein